MTQLDEAVANHLQKKIRRVALAFLSRRDYSHHEITQKIIRKIQYTLADSTHFLTDIQTVLTALEKENLISDPRFAENYVHYRRNKGYGPARITLELRERGIDEELIESSVGVNDPQWSMLAKKVWQKRFRSQLPGNLKERAQQIRFLTYRGFIHDHMKWLTASKNTL